MPTPEQKPAITIRRFRKKAVVVEALSFDELISIARNSKSIVNHSCGPDPIISFMFREHEIRLGNAFNRRAVFIPTSEGEMRMDDTDMLIIGLKGELYPCKPDVFAATYEPEAFTAPATTDIDGNVIADKELRRDLDAQLQKLKALPPSRERSLTVTKLQEAIMWLGMDLKRLNDTRPYPSSYDPTSTKVEPTADGLRM